MISISKRIIVTAILTSFLFVGQVSAGEKFKILLHWIKDAEMAGFLVADHESLYKKRGLDLELIGRDKHEKHVIDMLEEDKAQIGMSSGITFLTRMANNYQLKAFAAILQNAPLVLVSLKEKKLVSVKALKGKTIGYRYSSNIPIVRIILRHNNMDLKDVKIKKVGLTSNPLINGEVDVLTAYEFNMPMKLKMKNYATNVIYAVDNGFAFYGSLLIAKPKFIDKHKAELAKFLEATIEGWNLFFKDTKKYARIIADEYYPKSFYIKNSKDLTYEHQLLMASMMKQWLQYDTLKESYGLMSKKKWEAGCNILKDENMVKGNYDLSRIYTNDIVMAALGKKK